MIEERRDLVLVPDPKPTPAWIAFSIGSDLRARWGLGMRLRRIKQGWREILTIVGIESVGNMQSSLSVGLITDP